MTIPSTFRGFTSSARTTPNTNNYSTQNSGIAKGGPRGARAPPGKSCAPRVPPIWDLWCKILHLSLSSGAPPSNCCAPLVPPRIKSLVTPLTQKENFWYTFTTNHISVLNSNETDSITPLKKKQKTKKINLTISSSPKILFIFFVKLKWLFYVS